MYKRQNKTCIKIKIEDKGEARIKKINLDYELIKKAKVNYFIKAFLNYGIGMALLFSGFFLSKLSLENKIFAKATFVIMGGGIIPFVKATGYIKEFNETYRENKRKKLELDSLLKLYDIKHSNSRAVTSSSYNLTLTKSLNNDYYLFLIVQNHGSD